MRFTAVFLSVFASSMFCGSVVFATGPNAASPTVATAPATAPRAVPMAAPVISALPEAGSVALTPLPPSTASSAFESGIAAYQKNDFKTSRQWFRVALSKDPAQIVAWYDLGLAEQHLGNTGFAIAFWRKALALAPRFSSAKYAIDFTRAKIEHADIPHDVEAWETLRSTVLVYASSFQFALATATVFFIAGWFALIFIGRRRRALLDEKSLPAPPVGAVGAAILFVALLCLTICKVIDDQDLRATVIAKKVEAKALPDASSTPLFDLYEGLEVVVRQTHKDWIQVTYPGGATGWISRDSLFTMADRVTP